MLLSILYGICSLGNKGLVDVLKKSKKCLNFVYFFLNNLLPADKNFHKIYKISPLTLKDGIIFFIILAFYFLIKLRSFLRKIPIKFIIF